ncbi:basic proline-rich protein-like [Vidua chalybeata]|uniref:basic proline-rich protein-like n=1 Tax=Vidua chalybeata TaxID=81927 RepID=UPI0023A88E84|nr:basic proline-rich protein-like [Vidua chalybeata]
MGLTAEKQKGNPPPKLDEPFLYFEQHRTDDLPPPAANPAARQGGSRSPHPLLIHRVAPRRQLTQGRAEAPAGPGPRCPRGTGRGPTRPLPTPSRACIRPGEGGGQQQRLPRCSEPDRGRMRARPGRGRGPAGSAPRALQQEPPGTAGAGERAPSRQRSGPRVPVNPRLRPPLPPRPPPASPRSRGARARSAARPLPALAVPQGVRARRASPAGTSKAGEKRLPLSLPFSLPEGSPPYRAAGAPLPPPGSLGPERVAAAAPPQRLPEPLPHPRPPPLRLRRREPAAGNAGSAVGLRWSPAGSLQQGRARDPQKLLNPW